MSCGQPTFLQASQGRWTGTPTNMWRRYGEEDGYFELDCQCVRHIRRKGKLARGIRPQQQTTWKEIDGDEKEINPALFRFGILSGDRDEDHD